MATVLKYSFTPSSVFVNSKNKLKLTASNPMNGKPVQFSIRPADQIMITFPVGTKDTDLVADLDFTVGTVTDNFMCTKVGENFVITSVVDTILYPGDSIEVNFENVNINATTGKATVSITEYIGAEQEEGSATITKEKEELGVIAWVDPALVKLGGESPLFFQASAATEVKISNFPDGSGERSFPPPSGSVDVGVGSNTESQRIYQVTAWAGSNQSPPVNAVITQHKPFIQNFTPNNESITVDQQVTLTWKYLFGTDLTLQKINGRTYNPTSPSDINPGKDVTDVYNTQNYNVDQMPSKVDYTLIIDGFDEPAKHTVTFELEQIELVYLKFKNPELTQVLTPQISAVSWTQWGTSFPEPGTTKVTIHQPGGHADEFYLSTSDKVHPQIQYFSVVKGKLSWITANLDSLTLNPGNIAITGDDIKKGTHDIPERAEEVILTGVGTNGDPIRSVLRTTTQVHSSHAKHFQAAKE